MFKFNSDYDYYRFVETALVDNDFDNIVLSSLEYYDYEFKGKPKEILYIEPKLYVYEVKAKKIKSKSKFKKHYIIINTFIPEVIITPYDYISSELKHKGEDLNILLKYYLSPLNIHDGEYFIV